MECSKCKCHIDWQRKNISPYKCIYTAPCSSTVQQPILASSHWNLLLPFSSTVSALWVVSITFNQVCVTRAVDTYILIPTGKVELLDLFIAVMVFYEHYWEAIRQVKLV